MSNHVGFQVIDAKVDSGKVRDIQREELKDLFTNFDSDRRAEFIEKFTDIWDDCFDIHEGSSHHRVMIKSFLAGYDTLKTERDLAIQQRDSYGMVMKENLGLRLERDGLKEKLNKAMDELYTISCATVFDGMIQKENAVAARRVYNEIGEALIKEISK